MARYSIGQMTYSFFVLYNYENYELLDNIEENPIVDIFIKQETLGSDMKQLGFNYTCGEDVARIDEHREYHEYYNKELKDLVYERDIYIFRKFNYAKMD